MLDEIVALSPFSSLAHLEYVLPPPPPPLKDPLPGTKLPPEPLLL